MRRVHLLRREDGQAAAELALVLPILVALLLAIAQFGIVLNEYLTLTDAARAGARQAATARFTGDHGAAAIAAAKSSASALNSTKLGVTATASPDWNTSGNTVTVTVTYPYSIGILGWVVKSGNLSSSQTEMLE
jgi:Flp pilus assembly protein TadG